jgi:hypothetical protein
MCDPNERDNSETDNRDSVTEFEQSLEDALRDGIESDMNPQEDE